jgi:hypothetical protein
MKVMNFALKKLQIIRIMIPAAFFMHLHGFIRPPRVLPTVRRESQAVTEDILFLY